MGSSLPLTLINNVLLFEGYHGERYNLYVTIPSSLHMTGNLYSLLASFIIQHIFNHICFYRVLCIYFTSCRRGLSLQTRINLHLPLKSQQVNSKELFKSLQLPTPPSFDPQTQLQKDKFSDRLPDTSQNISFL